MNIHPLARKITLCSTFYDAYKLFRFIFLDPSFGFSVKGYEAFCNRYYQISQALVNMNNSGYNIGYEVHSCQLGLLQYHGFIPDVMRELIIEDKQTKALFEHMHTIFFFLYIRSMSIKYEQKYWYELLLHMVDINKIKSNYSFGDLNAAKNTLNLRAENVIDIITTELDVDAKNIKLHKNHIFKFIKTTYNPVGSFILQRHTIGSHYYTSRCLFVSIILTSNQYNLLLANLAKLRESLNLSAPEFRIVLHTTILDHSELGFYLGQSRLGLSCWLIVQTKEDLELQNYIF